MKFPRLEIVCIGTELLTGKVNTHTGFFGQKLPEVGLLIAREHTVSDEPRLMKEVFREAFTRSDVVISAGGLGPTFDDITRDVWARVVKRPLRIRPELLRDIEGKFRARGISMPPSNRRQAYVLEGADVIANPNGTAPGQYLEVGRKILVLLPGPSRELYPMFDSAVLPRLRARFQHRFVRVKTFHLAGVPESRIDQIIRPFVDHHKHFLGCRVTHGILASQSIITVKFVVEGRDSGRVDRAVRGLSTKVRRLLRGVLFGEDGDTLEGVVGRLLSKRGQTLAVAESCTGGLIAKLVTDQPGASNYFIEGITPYHNRSKMERLGVRKRTLEKFGAVSEQVAREMSVGLRSRSHVHYAVAVTGIAGPSGGTTEKPVGLVYISCSGPQRTVVKEFRFNGDRSWIRQRSALMALDILRQELLR